jgi:xylan 1,4-beta-xylosidase
MDPCSCFNAHHAPVGAFASFTLGYPGATGGFGLELGGPARQSLYIGAERRDAPGCFEALPFFAPADPSTNLENFVHEDQGDVRRHAALESIPWDSIQREFRPCTDTWTARDLRFTLYSPAWPLPEFDGDHEEELARRLLPAVFAELTVDNRGGTTPRRVFFGYAPDNRHDHLRELWNLGEEGIRGLANGGAYGLATDHAGADTSIQFSIEAILGEPHRDRLHFACGTTGIVDAVAAPGEVLTLRFVLGFHRGGIVTTGRPLAYAYTRWYPDLESVLRHGLAHFEDYRAAALAHDESWSDPRLGAARQFQLSQALRSYYGSTELLIDADGRPVWIVNEGEYRMMNTLDLTADQLFLELRQNPWTTRNVLEHFVSHYAYEDRVLAPADRMSRSRAGSAFVTTWGS